MISYLKPASIHLLALFFLVLTSTVSGLQLRSVDSKSPSERVRLETTRHPLEPAAALSDGKQAEASKQRQPIRRHIRLVTLELPPFMMKRRTPSERQSVGTSGPPPETNGTQWYGYCMDFFLELIKHLPYEISYEIREVADAKFGSKVRSVLAEKVTVGNKTSERFKRLESWNGMVGELKHQRAELALAPISVMAERELVVDFTVPFYDLVGIQILLRRPEVAQNWFKFLTVLDNDVWLSIGLAYLVTSFIIYIFDRLSPYSHKNMARIRRVRERSAHLAAGPTGVAAGGKSATDGLYLSRTLGQQSASSLSVVGGGQLAPLGTLEAASSAALSLARPHTFLSHPAGNELHPSRRRISLVSLRHRFGRDAGKGEAAAAAEEEVDEEESEEEDGKPDFNFRDSLWFCITSLTPQGGGEAPQNLSGRLVAGAWWLFCFIVIASYTANLAAFLTVSRLDIPIESLDDLAKQYRIKYAPIAGSAEQTYFERMAYIEEIFYNIWKEMSLNDSLAEEERSKFSVWDYPISDKYTKIWSQIQETAMPESMEAALKRVRRSTLDDGFALLANANLIKYAVMTDCNLKAVGEEFSRKPIALALAKGNERLRDDISYAILQLINRRFMEVLREKWWTNNPARVACDSSGDSEGISVENIGGVFLIILAGILLSFLVWAIERLAYTTKLDFSRALLVDEEGARAPAAAGPPLAGMARR